VSGARTDELKGEFGSDLEVNNYWAETPLLHKRELDGDRW
jgi:hypothetical protein